jgi:hypothetical protein
MDVRLGHSERIAHTRVADIEHFQAYRGGPQRLNRCLQVETKIVRLLLIAHALA